MIRTSLCFLALAALAACGGSRDEGLRVRGSETLVDVALAWAEAYKSVDSSLRIAVRGGGTGEGIAALIRGEVDLANASRALTPGEAAAARERGIDPVAHVVGHDALAVYVHRDNPKTRYTFAELAAIFGRGSATNTWEDLGVLVPDCRQAGIVCIGRQADSGTYEFFKHVLLGAGGAYRDGVRALHGARDVVEIVEQTPCAIGYSGLSHGTMEVQVHVAAVARDEGGPFVAPTPDTAVDGTYPIARPLLIYTNGKPGGKIARYLAWIRGVEGQRIVLRYGYAPLESGRAD